MEKWSEIGEIGLKTEVIPSGEHAAQRRGAEQEREGAHRLGAAVAGG